MDILNNEPIVLLPLTSDSQCSICLNDLTNKCNTNSCVHLFCFDCLKSWSNMCLQQCSSSEPTCPLCKKPFKKIYHSFDDNLGIFETYAVPIIPRVRRGRCQYGIYAYTNCTHNPRSLLLAILNTTLGNNLTLGTFEINERGELGSNRGLYYRHQSQNYPPQNLLRPIDGQERRIQVYVNNEWAVPLPNSDGRFRYFSPDFFRNSPIQRQRLRQFIHREIVALRESVRLEGPAMPFLGDNDVIVTTLILQSMETCDIRHLYLVEDLVPFLDVRAVHFCHELQNFAVSPYEIGDYDRNVQYTYRPHDSESTAQSHQEQSLPVHTVGENIELHSDDEEFLRPNTIERSSSTDDTNVDIQSHFLLSTNPLNSTSIDQPSTSTGIRDSLDIPNNNFQSVKGGSSRVSVSSQVKRSKPNPDSSSDDEESITATQGSQTVNLKSKKVKKVKKAKKSKKVKKKKKNDRKCCKCQVKISRSNPDSSSDDEESITATQGSQTANLKSKNVDKKKKKKNDHK